MISTGVIGIDSRLSMVPRSISRVTDSAVKISMVMVRMVPTRPGTMLSCGRRGRIVARVGADLERRRAGVGQGAVVAQRGLHELRRARRAPSRTPPDRSRRPRPAAPGLSPRRSARSKFAGISMPNSTLPEASSWSNSASSCDLMRDLEIVGVLAAPSRIERPTSLVLLQQHRGRQVARRGVDGVAEQQELHQRDHDDHGERDAVAREAG